jgi:NADH:ubiquinone oxidoreductase subunit 6 (subunit J)
MNFYIFFNDSFINMNIYLINLLCFLLITTALMVLLSKNSINSIFFLILCFLNSTNLLIINNIEYLAILFIIIYVGAIAILFLFVIMLLNIKTINLQNNNNILDNILILFIIILLIVFQLFFFNYHFHFIPSIKLTEFYTDITAIKFIDWSIKYNNLSSFNILGDYLYNFYYFEIILASFLLFIPMIGAITINIKKNNNLKKQKFYIQINSEIFKKIKKKKFIIKL